MLQTRIKPHFLLNIVHLAFNRVEDVDKDAAALLEKLSHILRYTVSVSKEKTGRTPLEEEVKYLMELVELKKYYNTDLVVDMDIAPHVLKEDILLIEQGILDEFLLNAFKYSATDSNSSIVPFIKISLATNEDNILTFTVENSTLINDSYPPNVHSTGVGLENVKHRLNMLYLSHQQLIIDISKIGVYKIILTIDLNEDYQ